MAELSTVARPYAKAAFTHASAQSTLSDWQAMLALAAQVVSNQDAADALASPQLSAEAKGKLILGACGDGLNEAGKNFISLLADNKRLEALPAISERFDKLKADYEKSVEVTVVSSAALNDDQVARLRDKLATKLNRSVNIKNEIDEALIGGLIIQAEDLVIDGSVRGKLAKLADTLGAQ